MNKMPINEEQFVFAGRRNRIQKSVKYQKKLREYSGRELYFMSILRL